MIKKVVIVKYVSWDLNPRERNVAKYLKNVVMVFGTNQKFAMTETLKMEMVAIKHALLRKIGSVSG